MTHIRVRMSKKLLSLDTSFLRSKSNKLYDIYPQTDYVHCISESTDLELNDSYQNTEKEKRTRDSVFIKWLDIEALQPRRLVFLKEIQWLVENRSIHPPQQIHHLCVFCHANTILVSVSCHLAQTNQHARDNKNVLSQV